MKYLNKIFGRYGCGFAIIGLIGCSLAACKEDLNYQLGPLPTASFTATPVPNNPNKIVVQSTSKNVFMWQWTFGNGANASGETDTAVYLKKGTYRIILTVFGHGGYDTTTQSVTIAQDMPGVNLVQGGDDMSDASDWQVLNTGGDQTTVNFTDNGAVFNSDGNSNGGIYQAIQVQAGVKYQFSANVQGSGCTNTWFEIYFGTSQPVSGQDYTDNKFVSLNTWSGCGTSAFNGDISSIGCAGNGTGDNGMITFASSGTIYLVIKAGSSGGSMGNGGITISHVNLIQL